MISKIVHIQLLKKKMQKYLQTNYQHLSQIVLGSKYTIETKYNNLAYLSLLTITIIIE